MKSRKEGNENEDDDYENEDDYYENEKEDEDEDDDETISQNKKIKDLNILHEIIDKSKSFEEQIELLKKLKDLNEYYPYNDHGDKKLKCKYFWIKLADMSNEIDKKLFEQIFGHTLIKLANKLVNITSKEENQIIVKNIEKNKEKIYEQKKCDWVIQPTDWRINLFHAIRLILDFN